MIFFVILLIGYFSLLFIGAYTLIYIYYHQTNYGMKLLAILSFITIFSSVLLYSTFFMISIIFYISNNVNLLIWKLSIIFGCIILIFSSLIYTFMKEFKNIPYFPFIIFIVLLGFLIGTFFAPNSIQISTTITPGSITNPESINYSFNIIPGMFLIIFQFSFVLYSSLLSYLIYKKAINKKSAKGLIFNVNLFIIPFLMYVLYIIFQFTLFRELHLLFLWGNIISVCYMLIKKPELLLEVTSKIYNINIYHKSGILLYSYKFGTSTDEIDSNIWGNILIGINHILSEFVDSKDQIEVLQTKSSDIIVNYDSYGFAVVLITNRKNAILKRLMNSFTNDFRTKYEKELIEIQDLNKLINVSEFKETKEIIEKNFQMFL
ncbi:MAG: hypothetical protein ACFFEY_11490 [Candidatus Thorarchaeota archaeon]